MYLYGYQAQQYEIDLHTKNKYGMALFRISGVCGRVYTLYCLSSILLFKNYSNESDAFGFYQQLIYESQGRPPAIVEVTVKPIIKNSTSPLAFGQCSNPFGTINISSLNNSISLSGNWIVR